MRLAWLSGAAIALLWLLAGSALAGDPQCLGSYGGWAPRSGGPIRFGVDSGIAGSVRRTQVHSAPDDPARDLAALRALRPPGRVLVARLNRLFWSAGQAGIRSFRRMASRYARAGFEVEVQVRYHPPAGQAGHIAAWKRYVLRVVDALGPDRQVVAMTITNEANVSFSPNTSDGYYPGAEDALIGGIEAARAEAVRRGFRQLRFGFTYAYRFIPSQDAAFFAYLGAHGGAALRRSLSFIGLDFYPGSVYPAVLPRGGYRAALAQAAGVLRRCLAPKADIGPRVPIWITENGVATGKLPARRQATALAALVQAAHAYAGTFDITDYRWFNLRDSVSGAGSTLFSTDGLLRADYSRKPSFVVYRNLMASLGQQETRSGPAVIGPPTRSARRAE